MQNDKSCSKEFSKRFVIELLELAEIAAGAEGDTIDFTLIERDGIRMDVSISFSYTRIEEDN